MVANIGRLRQYPKMLTALDADPNVLDEAERSFVDKIREHGWLRTRVLGELAEPAFSYTTGFWRSAGAPEMIVFSFKSEFAHEVFWNAFRDYKAGVRLDIARKISEIFQNSSAYLFLVSKRYYQEYLGWSLWFYGGDDFPCLQLVWSDRNGVFPWEPGFDETFRLDQPDLTENGWRASIVN